VKLPRPLGKPCGVALPVQVLMQVLQPLLQRGDLLMLRRHPVCLLLHRGVEQENADNTNSKNDYDAGRVRNLATAPRRRTRSHV
jgi:hypothetical protein